MSRSDADAGQVTPRSRFYDEGRFSRLLPTLPPFAADRPLIRGPLIEVGAPVGPMDTGDDLSDPATLITDPAKSVNKANERPIRKHAFPFPSPAPMLGRARHEHHEQKHAVADALFLGAVSGRLACRPRPWPTGLSAHSED